MSDIKFQASINGYPKDCDLIVMFLQRALYLSFFLIALLSYSWTWAADKSFIRYFQTDDRYGYRIKLLKLVLEKTSGKYGNYVLVPYEGGEDVSQARGLYELEKNNFDIAFLPYSLDREARFLPVKKDIMKGLLGLRIFLIRKDDEASFANVKGFDQLRTDFVAGFCDQWADIGILKSNGIRVVSTSTYKNLFPMLSYKRFDYFPRGINEIWKELEVYGSSLPNIAVEKRLALYYPMPVYFFVNKANEALAKRIYEGLEKTENDGSFKKLFMEEHKEDLLKLDLKDRRIFIMKNPDLDKDVADPDTSWWMNPVSE